MIVHKLLVICGLYNSVSCGYDGPVQSSYGGGQSSYGSSGPSFGAGFGSFHGIEGFNPTWFRGSAVARGHGYKKPNAYNSPVPPAPVDSYGPPKAGYEKPLGIPAIEAPPP